MRFERSDEPVLPPVSFVTRVIQHAGLAAILLGVALAIGVVGYRYAGGLPWIDAFLNASMILGGMGPVDRMEGDGAKLFSACYALFSGLAFITTSGILIGPFVHRILHRFHAE